MVRSYLNRIQIGSKTINQSLILNLISKNSEPILDVGCGDGLFTKKIGERCSAKIHGIEISEELAYKASERGVKVKISNANKPFPYENESFAMVISNQVIEHLCDTDNFIKEINRVLIKEGVAIVSTPNLSNLINIISLFFGYQPFSADVSDELICGNPFNPGYMKEKIGDYMDHRRIFTYRSLKELFEFHGFYVEEVYGAGLHPFPLFIQKMFNLKRYGNYITIKAIKK